MTPKQREPYGGAPPHRAGSDTSRAAAGIIAPDTESKRDQVYGYILSCGTRGATDAEIQTILGLPVTTEVPRRRELVLKGLVHDSGERRESNLTGNKMVVWKAGKGNGKETRTDWKGHFLALNKRVAVAVKLIDRKADEGDLTIETLDEVKNILRPPPRDR